MNREGELKGLEDWWSNPAAVLDLFWGRRRVGKTALLQEFAKAKQVVLHTGSTRPVAGEMSDSRPNCGGR